jgi:hypothetical protein
MNKPNDLKYGLPAIEGTDLSARSSDVFVLPLAVYECPHCGLVELYHEE